MCHSGNTLNTSDDLEVYLATDGCFKTMDTLSAWTEHKVFKYLQDMERNKKVTESHVSCAHCRVDAQCGAQ